MFKTLIISCSITLILSACGGGNPTTQPSSTSAPADTSGSNTENSNTSKTFEELCSSAGVLFCEDFEQGIKSSWIRDGGDIQLINGQVNDNEGEKIVELLTYENIQSSKLLYVFENKEEVYIRYDVQYATDYDNSGGSHGPLLGGSQTPPWGVMGKAGTRPSGSDYFVLNHEPIKTVGIKGEFGFYAYFVNMEGTPGNTWGNNFKSTLPTAPLIIPGQWHCVEFGMRLNTAGANNTDGKAFFWVDGTQHGDFSNFQWRSSPDLMINTLMLDSYNHFNGGALPITSPNRVRYDNVIISTQPVGCL